MSQFIETIQYKNGSLQNLKFHNKRFNSCRKTFYGSDEAFDLQELIDTSSFFKDKTYRITVFYSENIDEIRSIEYKKKTIGSLKIVEVPDDFNYSHKYADRSAIDRLLIMRESCDDIIMVRNNLITDISYANLVFYDGSKFITPASPLLKGTKREKLLEEKAMVEEEIKLSDLHLFKYYGIINAMLELDDYRIEMKGIY
ncbi:MAG: aminotransferase class IV [Bacteroidales bacterium]|nr:aminotransferase class IV [Bacteroidales bacterium]MCF8391388.1 aminotransferase class IV [Bacteroidales bacterium]